MRDNRQSFPVATFIVGLLLTTVTFFGFSSPASAEDEVTDDSILCQHGGGGTTYYIVIGKSVLAKVNPDEVPDDPCNFFFTSGWKSFDSVGRCGDDDITRFLCDEYGKRITSDDLAWWDGGKYRFPLEAGCELNYENRIYETSVNLVSFMLIPEGNCVAHKEVWG